MSADFANSALEMYESVEDGHLVPDPRAAKRIMATTFAAFAREVLAPLLGAARR
jgi:hypothetical protein